MAEEAASAMRSVRALVHECRTLCLWSLRADYYPETPAEALRVLDLIERHGDVAAFRRAAALRQWLSRHASARSAV